MFPTVCEHCKIASYVAGCLRTSAVERAVGDAKPAWWLGRWSGCPRLASTGAVSQWLRLAAASYADALPVVLLPVPDQLWEAVEPTASTLWLRRVSSGLAAFSTGSARTGTSNVVKVANTKPRTKYFQRATSHFVPWIWSCFFFLMVKPIV